MNKFLIYTKLIYAVFALMKIQLQSVDSKNQAKSLQGFMILKVLYLHFVPADSADHILSR